MHIMFAFFGVQVNNMEQIDELRLEVQSLKAQVEELTDALLGMAMQYLTRKDRNGQWRLTHDFMSAGEQTIPLLEKLGKIKKVDAVSWVVIE